MTAIETAPIETARALAGAGAGAKVTLAVRNLEAGAGAAADITATTGRDDVAVAALEVTEPCRGSDLQFAEFAGPDVDR